MTSKLGEMNVGQGGKIVRTAGPAEFHQRLLEMGLLEGSWIEILHEAPVARDPIAVRVRGTLIALRRSEANWIEVQVGASR